MKSFAQDALIVAGFLLLLFAAGPLLDIDVGWLALPTAPVIMWLLARQRGYRQGIEDASRAWVAVLNKRGADVDDALRIELLQHLRRYRALHPDRDVQWLASVMPELAFPYDK